MVEIYINDDITIRKDSECWVVLERVERKRRKDETPYYDWKQTYHPTLKQACSKVIDLAAGNADFAVMVKHCIEQAEAKICAAIDGMAEVPHV